MSRSRRAAALAIACSMLSVTLLIGSSSAQEASPTQAEETRVLTIGADDDIRTTNPLRSLNGIESWTFSLMYSGMLWYDRDDLSAAPGLTSSWTQSEDGLTWTFNFREGLKWSDGEPLTAHDFAFTANFLIENDKDIVSWNKNTDFPFTESITAPDDTTLIWKTTQPTFAPGKPEYYLVLPEHIWGDLSGDEISKFKNFPNPVVSGPFILTEREQGQFWRLEPNPNWFGDKPEVDEIVFRLFNTDEAIVQALKRGTIDFAEYLPAPLFESLAGTSGAGSAGGAATHIGSAQNFANLNFNLLEADKSTGHPALLDVQVRRAIEFAIDKELLIEKIRRGYSIPGTTVVPPSYPFWHYEPTEEELITFDPAEANRILDEAGYEDTDNDGVREMPGGGRPLELRLNVTSSDTDAIKSAVFVESWLKDIGIDVTTSSMNNSSILEQYYAGDFDMYWYGWGTSPDPDFLLSTFTTEECGFWSDTCWDNPEYNALYEEQKAAFDPEERQVLVHELQRMIYNEVPEIVMWYDQNLESYRADRWTGFVPLPTKNGDLLDQTTPYSAVAVRPASQGAASGTAEGGLPGIVWGALVAIVVIGVVAFVVVRRRGEERA
jgi:peptide/nickel transport system substrate-binding protein